MGRRHRAREFAVQLLFQLDVTGDGPDDSFAGFWEGKRVPPETQEFAEQLVRGTWERRAEVDAVLAGSSEHWRIPRMAAVDRNVLRAAIYELLHGDTPPVVVIDEAIEIAKKYGDDESGPFVNGILDAVRKRLEAGELGDGCAPLAGLPPDGKGPPASR